MEFKDLDELKEYIRKRALRKTKFLLNLSRLGKIDTSKGTLNDLYKVALHEVKKEIMEEINNGTIVVMSEKDITKEKKL